MKQYAIAQVKSTWKDFTSLLLAIFNRVRGKSTLRYRRTRYPNFFYARLFLNAQSVQKFHWNINCWTNAEVIAWKNSYEASCTAVAVAAAIFAGIGVTSLQLPNINNTLWATRALFSASMALGILSVITATVLQRTVYKLSDHITIRLWLSRGKTRVELDYPPPYCDLPLESSATVLTLLEAPSLLLNLAAIVYLAGFLLYSKLGWSVSNDASTSDSPQNERYIFILVCGVIGAALLYLALLYLGQVIDEEKRKKHFGLDEQEHDGETNPELQRLEEWIDWLSNMPRRNQKTTIEPGYDSIRAVRVGLENGRGRRRERSPPRLRMWGSDEYLVRDVGVGSTWYGDSSEKAGNVSGASGLNVRNTRRGVSDDSISPAP